MLEVYKQDVWYEHINIYLTYDILGGKSMDFEFRTAGGLFLFIYLLSSPPPHDTLHCKPSEIEVTPTADRHGNQEQVTTLC